MISPARGASASRRVLVWLEVWVGLKGLLVRQHGIELWWPVLLFVLLVLVALVLLSLQVGLQVVCRVEKRIRDLGVVYFNEEIDGVVFQTLDVC